MVFRKLILKIKFFRAINCTLQAEEEQAGVIVMCAKLEAELASLEDEEKKNFLCKIINIKKHPCYFTTKNRLCQCAY